ncbi:helix-turn-helix transcriptional regulator [Brucella thiophenivorans]|uniref:HTH-type quorum sensing-dependent transcriptional regulator VjbR n=1 Tax=Brucella thiophenivorans TaxID=571255 RepID=A0A256FAK2_9HYPH|nr:LuxR family transcriptional regulator [Brucella thiophenivorans]OYR11461.1 autoinducer binding domain protein [Brucella thiophenivorans]
MRDQIENFRQNFTAHKTLDGRIDEIFLAMKPLGFEALIYDYTPSAFDMNGEMMGPSLMKLRNISDDMPEFWAEKGYFRIDPVQRLACRASVPFFWNYEEKSESLLQEFMTEDTAPVAHYLHERDISAGVTVPIHMPHGDYATVTGVFSGTRSDFKQRALRYVADFNLMAQIFHQTAYELFDERTRGIGKVHLTDRERECLRYAAEGFSAKEISRIITRSVPTVVMHLNAAAKKLGAKNRTQAVVRATRARLLDA